MKKIKAGIIGGAGYTAGELIRLLINHSFIEKIFIQSSSQANQLVSSIHKDLTGECNDCFLLDIDPGHVDVVFLCKGHGESKKYLEKNPLLENINLIDLSQDFRLRDSSNKFVYGLPELNRELIIHANKVANPGCFATSIQLGLIPAIAASLTLGNIHLSGLTGSTGAGQALSPTTHFSWRSSNSNVYKPLNHQHILEVNESLIQIGKPETTRLNFIPYRGAFTRGIITTSYFETNATQLELEQCYQDYYSVSPFSHYTKQIPDIKMVLNTNKCLINVTKIEDQAVIVSVIDNLLKGASGQAVQNMNLMFGFDESEGLKLKGSAY